MDEIRSNADEREYVVRIRVPRAPQLPRIRVETVDPLFWLPEETRRHLNQMQREGLLAIRSVLDAMIDRLETQPTSTGARAPRIEID
ncbi:MAG: hypothetical protein RMM58_02765 [Chloroflexota bacterium]|nr:hypothetical protein [Dehalococcoidia bacterium]MDW8252779.1 hypothetical protein [Chloroflexota bacterium]